MVNISPVFSSNSSDAFINTKNKQNTAKRQSKSKAANFSLQNDICGKGFAATTPRKLNKL